MKKELKNVLMPVDFKESSMHAARYAYNMARKYKGELFLLYVIETSGFFSDLFTSEETISKVKSEAEEKLAGLAKSLKNKETDVKINILVERGKPYRKILETAGTINARIIILGENHQETEKDPELGTTIYHVTLKSEVPVLTYKGKTEEMANKIVVPLDLTKEARKQLFSAIAYGLNYDAEIHLVSVLIGGIKMRDSRIFRKLKRAKKILEENGIKCSIKLFKRSETPPYKRVLEYADDIQAGLILVMTHQEGFTYDNYIGAFAHHIINESKVPVLSLTSSATNVDYTGFIKGMVDPMGVMFKDNKFKN
ncbi:MAG: universal stress protein [Bacteroidales bacterium]|nr:universal stress protein [Bacteroidales bacterium]